MMPFNARHQTTVREYAGGSVGGILKTSSGTSSSTTNPGALVKNEVDLLVFGYACKVFRDDAKAREIDQGKHLIPWMGDSGLKIDRYDVRGALYDLAPHEAPTGGGYGNRLDYLSAEEQRAEQLCEEERYLYLYNNEEELILQQEEDLKRLTQDSNGGGYSQVDFQYGYDAGNGSGVQHGPIREEATNSPGCEEADQVFQLPRNFEVPASLLLPETMKQHAIIEKTARFIATQGVQMEILLKAKQSNNTQFEFLTQNSALNAYYKYVVEAIKNGKYPAEEPPKPNNINIEKSAEFAKSAAAAIATNAPVKSVITVPTIKYKPSANCAYTQLISKIKGVPLPEVLDENATSMSGTNSPTTSEATNSAVGDFTPVLLQYNGNTFITAAADDNNSNSNSQLSSNLNSNSIDAQPQVEILKNSSALALAQNYSDTESEPEEETPIVKSEKPKPEPILNFPIPPDSLKNIIDKTATYVIKNGRQFEETLRTKSEERFTFLLPDNEFYPYYMYKITNDPDAASKESKTRKAAAVAAALLSKKGLSSDKTIAPVSFSIKSKDEPATTSLTPALPQETSDDDDDRKINTEATTSATTTRTVPEHVQKAIQLVESQLMARNAQLAVVPAALSTVRTPATASSMPTVRSRFDIDYNTATAAIINSKTHVKGSKAEQERNALFEQQQQNRQKELKKAEEKVKDKLAQIAREKLGGLISKEKQLQLERKRKAMAFLNQIKGSSPSTTVDDNDNATPEKQIKRNRDDENASDDSEVSVHSIPITSFGPDEKTDDEEEEAISTTHTTQREHTPPPPKIKKAEVANTPPPPPPPTTTTTTVTLSDDDDVQLVGEIKPPQLRYHSQRHKSKSSHKRRSRSREESSSSKSRRKKKSKKRSRSRSRSRKSEKNHRGRYSSSDSENGSIESSDSQRRRQRRRVKQQREKHASNSPSTKRKDKKRKY